MTYTDPERLTFLEGLEAVRLRPGMWIGGDDEQPSRRVRLLAVAITDIALESRPQQIRIGLWGEDAVTIAHDGQPLPIEPEGLPVHDVPHPALYRPFMVLRTPALNGLAILNALSERLVVSTMHGGRRYRTAFSRGMIASLLRARHCRRPLATTWLTYRPDATIIGGEAMTVDALAGIAERVALNMGAIAELCGGHLHDVPITVEDRTAEEADWD